MQHFLCSRWGVKTWTLIFFVWLGWLVQWYWGKTFEDWTCHRSNNYACYTLLSCIVNMYTLYLSWNFSWSNSTQNVYWNGRAVSVSGRPTLCLVWHLSDPSITIIIHTGKVCKRRACQKQRETTLGHSNILLTQWMNASKSKTTQQIVDVLWRVSSHIVLLSHVSHFTKLWINFRMFYFQFLFAILRPYWKILRYSRFFVMIRWIFSPTQ